MIARECGLLLLKLGQLQDALLRNVRVIVGIKLHTGQMAMPQAVDFKIRLEDMRTVAIQAVASSVSMHCAASME